jgi:hypothetical protein
VPSPYEPADTHQDLQDGVTITNEFTSVRVRVVKTGNGERLEIQSLRMPHSIRLDALLLEALTWQDPLALGKLLEEPFGPTRS